MAVLGRAAERAALAAALAVAAGCGAGSEAGERVDRCVDRLLASADARTNEARDYVRRTYCDPFERRGWLDEDGVLAIDAARWLAGEEECETEDGSVCEPVAVIDCALLRHVRRAEVRIYLRELGDVRCDDATPLDELGVP